MEVKTRLRIMGIILVVLPFQPIQAVTVFSGVNFQHPILRTDYFDEHSLDANDPIIFRPSLVSKPSLPRWLKYIQPDQSSDGYLYGTPQGSNIGEFQLEIIGLNSKTYESARKLIQMTVEEYADTSKYEADFFINNLNLADILNPMMQDDFKTAVNAIWGEGSQVIIQSLTSAQDLELRVPLNPQPEQKYGIKNLLTTDACHHVVRSLILSRIDYANSLLWNANVTDIQRLQQIQNRAARVVLGGSRVQITIGAQVESEVLASVISDAVGPCQQDNTYTPPNITGFFQPAFIIEWCNVSMTAVSSTQHQNESSSIFLGGMYHPPIMQVEDADHFLEFLLLVVVPCAIMFCSILVLGYLMCCGRSRRKELTNASELQLTHHRTLRHACRDLRTMSNRRDGTASVATLTPIGTPTVGSQRSHSRSRGYDEYPWANSTPQVNHRGMATPPPYRTPPNPHKHRETSFSNQASDKRRLSEPSNARDDEYASMRPVPPFMGSSTSDRGVRPRHV